MMVKLFSWCSVLLFSFAACGPARHTHTGSGVSPKDALTGALHKIYQQGDFAGFSAAVVNEHGSLYEIGVGHANVAAGLPYTSSTVQNIGSISKTLVGVALLKAQELGKLDLDDPINQYLPFPVNNPFFPDAPITIRHLATHTSTITDNDFYLKRNYILKPGQDLSGLPLFLEDGQTFNAFDSLVSMSVYLQRVLETGGLWYQQEGFLHQRPGELFEYSNVGTCLAAFIVERATGTPFDRFTRQHILAPLKMDASGWHFDEIDFSRHSVLYRTPDSALPFYSLITYPDGNFITSASDLAKFLTELVKGFSGSGTLLGKESYREYFKAQLDSVNFRKRNVKNPYSDEYNLGIFIGQSFAGNIGHTGGDPGVSTIMFFNPATRTGRLLIVNTNINDKKGNDAFYAIWDALGKYGDKLASPAGLTH